MACLRIWITAHTLAALLYAQLGNGLDVFTSTPPPFQATIGENVTLSCEYNPGRIEVYSVKWYKDSLEVLRFLRPPTDPMLFRTRYSKYIPPESATANETMTTVKVHVVDENAAGTYTCEIVRDAPLFDTGYLDFTVKVVENTTSGIPDKATTVEETPNDESNPFRLLPSNSTRTGRPLLDVFETEIRFKKTSYVSNSFQCSVAAFVYLCNFLNFSAPVTFLRNFNPRRLFLHFTFL